MQTPKHGKRGKKRFHMTKRIGSTTYKVTIHFSQTSRETLDETKKAGISQTAPEFAIEFKEPGKYF